MDLFSDIIVQPKNLLPREGVVKYHGTLIPLLSADNYFSRLLAYIDWNNDEAVIYGKRIVTKRKVAWYAEKPFEYTYSKTTKHALPWTDDLLALKTIVESKAEQSFNSCLLNLYHDGSEGMAWHSDSERELKKDGAIGSLSFGADRKFSFRHKKTKEKMSIILEHGSLLVMEGKTQTYWQHCLPPTKAVNKPRINLTFRNIVQNEKNKFST